jgi:hypothetical protein
MGSCCNLILQNIFLMMNLHSPKHIEDFLKNKITTEYIYVVFNCNNFYHNVRFKQSKIEMYLWEIGCEDKGGCSTFNF